MQINVIIVLYLLFLHWIADFVFQTDKMAQGKSKNWRDLLSHTVVYSCILWLGIGVLFSFKYVVLGHCESFYIPPVFALITFLFHTTQDYITSRINSRLWADKKVHQFFVSIGFDQLLHFIQLILTYQLLKQI